MIALLSLLLACDGLTETAPVPSAVAPGTLQLVYSGNVHGEIEPCG
jgi:hypothetical protein